MKTSNILLSLFLVATLAIGVISSIQVASKVKQAKVRTEMVDGDRANMSVVKLPGFTGIAIEGNRNLKVFIKRKNIKEPQIWVEKALKDSVRFTVDNQNLFISTTLPGQDIIVIVEVPEVGSLQVNNSNCSLDGFVGDTLDIKITGNAFAVLNNSKIGSVNFDGSQNSKVEVYEGFEVEKWNILLSGNAKLKGVSPKSKLSMSVKDNAKIELSN